MRGLGWSRPSWRQVKKTIFYYATHYTWAFVAIMAVTLLSCFFSIFYLATLENDLKDIYENDIRGGDSIQTAYTALLGIESAVKDLAVFSDKRNQTRARAEIRTRTGVLKAAMNMAAPRFYTPRAKQALLSSKNDLKGYLVALDKLVASHDAGKKVDGSAILRLREISVVLQKDFDLLVANRIANSSIGIKDLVGQLRLSLIITVIILVLTVVVRLVLYVAGHPHWNGRGPAPPQG